MIKVTFAGPWWNTLPDCVVVEGIVQVTVMDVDGSGSPRQFHLEARLTPPSSSTGASSRLPLQQSHFGWDEYRFSLGPGNRGDTIHLRSNRSETRVLHVVSRQQGLYRCAGHHGKSLGLWASRAAPMVAVVVALLAAQQLSSVVQSIALLGGLGIGVVALGRPVAWSQGLPSAALRFIGSLACLGLLYWLLTPVHNAALEPVSLPGASISRGQSGTVLWLPSPKSLGPLRSTANGGVVLQQPVRSARPYIHSWLGEAGVEVGCAPIENVPMRAEGRRPCPAFEDAWRAEAKCGVSELRVVDAPAWHVFDVGDGIASCDARASGRSGEEPTDSDTDRWKAFRATATLEVEEGSQESGPASRVLNKLHPPTQTPQTKPSEECDVALWVQFERQGSAAPEVLRFEGQQKPVEATVLDARNPPDMLLFPSIPEKNKRRTVALTVLQGTDEVARGALQARPSICWLGRASPGLKQLSFDLHDQSSEAVSSHGAGGVFTIVQPDRMLAALACLKREESDTSSWLHLELRLEASVQPGDEWSLGIPRTQLPLRAKIHTGESFDGLLECESKSKSADASPQRASTARWLNIVMRPIEGSNLVADSGLRAWSRDGDLEVTFRPSAAALDRVWACEEAKEDEDGAKKAKDTSSVQVSAEGGNKASVSLQWISEPSGYQLEWRSKPRDYQVSVVKQRCCLYEDGTPVHPDGSPGANEECTCQALEGESKEQWWRDYGSSVSHCDEERSEICLSALF